MLIFSKAGRRILCSGAAAVIAIFCWTQAAGQTTLEGKRLTIDVRDKRLAEVLDLISEKAGIAFAYNPKVLPVNKKISYSCINKPLADILNDLAKIAGITYTMIENQIVLQRAERKETKRDQFTLSGYVRDGANGEALIGATLSIPELQSGAISNAFGFYSITIPKGDYTIAFSFIGFEKYSTTLELSENIALDIRLNEKPPLLSEIAVHDAPISVIEDIQIGKLNVRPAAVEDRPALFGETDVLKSLESVPGVKLHSDGSTFYYVRGGNRDQNLVLVDDAPIYNPSHMLGLFSTIIPDAINDITLYKGNSPASLGGRLSSVLDIRTKKGNDQHFQSWGSLGVISTKVGAEGPIKKDKSSFLISARVSRLKWFFQLVDKDISQFNFYDITAKTNFKLNRTNRLLFSFYTGGDNYIANNSGISWTNTAGTFRWNHTINDRLFVNTTLAASSYDYSLYTDVANKTRWTSHISNVNLKSDFSYFLQPENEVTFGAGINGYNFNPGNIEIGAGAAPVPPTSIRNSVEVILYGNHEVKLDEHWGVNYGMRLSSWTDTGPSFEFVFDQNKNPIDTLHFKKGQNYKNYVNAEPRATLSYVINEQSSFKAGFSRNAQNIHLISNSTSPFTSLEVWLPSSINIRPQLSNQVSFGYYRTLAKSGLVLEAETFYKKMMNQIDYTPHAETLLNPLLEGQLLFGNAKAYGAEFLLKKDEGRLRGMAGYTWSRAKRTFAGLNNGQAYNAFYDRPNQINLMLTYDLSLRWNFGMNWNYSTGAPYSSPISFYKYNDQEVPVYGQKNNDRLPAYHRMDISATVKLNKNPEKKFRHSLSLSIFNLYGRKNILFVNYNKAQDPSGDFKIPANLLDANRITSQYYLFKFTPSLSYNVKWL